jgi:hypothetical protein
VTEAPNPDLEITPLYGGLVLMEFDRKRHKYWAVDDGVRLKVPSVTGITGIIDKSSALMHWGTNNAIDVIKAAIEPDSLYSQDDLDRIWRRAGKRSYAKTRAAAEIGTDAHAWLELYFSGQDPPLPEDDAPHRRCVDASMDWLAAHRVRFIHTERAVYSRRHKYSGRLDGIAEVDGELCLIDWKTGNGIYPEAVLQSAAYNYAWEEETGKPLARRHVIRLGKNDGRFYSHTYEPDTLSDDFEAFLGAKILGQRVKAIEKAERNRQVDWMEELVQA